MSLEIRHDCPEFALKGSDGQRGDCQTDGHYLCKNCKHIASFENMELQDSRYHYYHKEEIKKQNKTIMQSITNFFIDDTFYADIENYLMYNDLTIEDIQELPEDYTLEVEETTLEQMFQFEIEGIKNAVMEMTNRWEDRFPSDSARVEQKIRNAIFKSVDLGKLNSMIPSLYYPNGKKIKVNKHVLLAAF